VKQIDKEEKEEERLMKVEIRDVIHKCCSNLPDAPSSHDEEGVFE